MESKYKVGLLRLNLVVAALLPALMTPAATSLSERLLLWLISAWLGVSALVVEFSHRRPPLVPWQLLPSLLLGALLWLAPERYPLWLWAWAALIMLPQPGWMILLNALLAGLTWWWLAIRMPLEHALLSGVLLSALLLLGLAQARSLAPLRSLALQRVRLVPGMHLWPRRQLSQDLARERARCLRDSVHCELLLLRTSRYRLWPLARRLCSLTQSFEHCYRLDGRTLAALLLSPDDVQAIHRREALLRELKEVEKVRVTPLNQLVSLNEEYRALTHSPLLRHSASEAMHG